MNDNEFAMIRELEKIEGHDHFCLLYETQDEQSTAAFSYVQIGLERREHCLYIVDENTIPSVMTALSRRGIDVASAVKSGQLTITSQQQLYLHHGFFDPDGMIQFLNEATLASKASGFSTLRIAGEMTWVLGGEQGIERIMEYEAKLNRFFLQNNASAICQYNRRRFSPEVIRDAIRAHPQVIVGGVVCKNYYFVPATEHSAQNETEKEVQRLLNNLVSCQQNETALRAGKEEFQIINKRLKADLKEQQQVQDGLLEMILKLKQKKSDAEEASRIKSEYVSNVSHDLRTPLNAILGYSHLLLDEAYGVISEDQRDPLEGIRRNAHTLVNLVNDVLDFEKIESGKNPPHLSVVDINSLVEGLVVALKPMLYEKSLQVQLKMDEALPFIESDANKIKQILLNLLSNAIKFTRIGGIIVSTRSLPSLEAIEIKIQDTGIGIRPEDLHKIFDAYHQVDSTGNLVSEGFGLGLAIVKELTQILKATIKVESDYGKGSQFTVVLPLRFNR